ncbi:MAG: hypothetical protein WCR52_09220 [Bacteroidota bacterium]
MQIKSAIVDIIRQMNSVLEQIAPQDYRKTLPEFEGGSLGQHFRHILEFFQCLEIAAYKGIVDYAARERNLLYEEHPNLTIEAFESFAAEMANIDVDMPLNVRAEFSGGERPLYQSTIGREMLFVYDHAIHHLAIIKIGLICHFPQIKSEKDLGVSPSTIIARKAKSS